MRKGGGKAKGSAFERSVCRLLSEWVSGGKQTDLFWRTAMSGGRSTVARRKGVVVRQAGDITAVAPEGHSLTDHFYIECKSYKNVQFDGWVFSDRGLIADWWAKARSGARRCGLWPMLIVKQNNWPVFVVTHFGELDTFAVARLRVNRAGAFVYLFTEVLKGDYNDRHF